MTTCEVGHKHRWRIAENNARFSEGVCVHCGIHDLFDNWAVEDRGMTWDENAKYRMRLASGPRPH